MREIFLTPDVEEFINKADTKIKSKVSFVLSYLTNDKNPLCEPYVKHISTQKYSNFYELRTKASNAMVRIIFSVNDENIILLYAFYKNDKRDTQKTLECAYRANNSVNHLSKLIMTR